MGKLNIAHHKSYHPYRKDNIEKVRRDEEEARLKEAKEEGRMTLADSEARIALLRERASATTSSKSKRREDDKRERELLEQATNADARREALAPASSSLTSLGSGKHINLFEELEQGSATSALATSRELEKLRKGKGKETAETEKGVPLAPSAKDLKPWYSEKKKDHDRADDDIERTRDLSHKSRSDPLTAIQRELATRFPPAQPTNHTNSYRERTWGAPPSLPHRSTEPSQAPTKSGPDRAAREARESSERARAQALKAQRLREAAGSATPSTVRGDDDAFMYGDQFHSREVAEAHRRREYADVRERAWGGERSRGRGRDDWGEDRRRIDRGSYR